MDLTTPWTPYFNGNALPPFNRLNVVLEEDLKPSSRHYPTWVKSSLTDIFTKAPQAEEALWDCVLSLWRLKITEPTDEESNGDILWAQHVSTWLVSSQLIQIGKITSSLTLARVAPPSVFMLPLQDSATQGYRELWESTASNWESSY